MASASGGTDYVPLEQGSRFRSLDSDFPPILRKQRKRNITNIDPRTGFVLADKVLGEFFVMKNIDKSASFEKVSPFFINKALNNHIGDGHITKRIRDGSLLIKCKNDTQTQKLLNLDQQIFGNTYKVSVQEHTQLNSVQGLIYCWDAKFLSEDEILDGLQDEKVIDVHKIKKKVNGVLTNTALCILTFKRSILPTSIHFGFHEVLVKQYIPNPLRCLNCFRFGHSRKSCKNERVCANCSQSFHEPNECNSPTKCVNCLGTHNNWNKNCPKYVRESGIQKIKTQDKISYFEARKKFIEFYPRSEIPVTGSLTQNQTYSEATTNASSNKPLSLSKPRVTQFHGATKTNSTQSYNPNEKLTEIRSPSNTKNTKYNPTITLSNDNTNMIITDTQIINSKNTHTETQAHSSERSTNNEDSKGQSPQIQRKTRSSTSNTPNSTHLSRSLTPSGGAINKSMDIT